MRIIEAMSDWDEMDGATFRNTGLLYMVNRTVMWPLGLALRAHMIETPVEGVAWLDVVMLPQPETITEGRIDVDKEPGSCHPQERFLHFAESRVLLMPTEMEREMAAKALRKIIPGFGISPLRE